MKDEERDEVLARFMENVQVDPTSDCWLWTGKTLNGYGRFKVKRGTDYDGAHRVSYALHKGDPGRLHVCHTCDRPPCVNPDHLWAGTHRDNMADMRNKGRNKKRGRPKLYGPVQTFRANATIDGPTKVQLERLAHHYGSEAQAIRIAIRQAFKKMEEEK